MGNGVQKGKKKRSTRLAVMLHKIVKDVNKCILFLLKIISMQLKKPKQLKKKPKLRKKA